MKFHQKILLAAMGLLFFSSLQALDLLVEAKGGYYLPTNSLTRNIYKGGGIYGLEATFRVKNNFYGFLSGSCMPKSGHSTGFHYKTRLIYVPIGAGLKYFVPWSWADFYFGLGILPAYAHTRDHSPFVVENLSKWGVGGIAKVGIIMNRKKGVFIDFYADYSYIKISNHDTDHGMVIPTKADLSGFNFGVGLGYRFGESSCRSLGAEG